jgi:DNA-binding CsgD family transcriptional regulator
MYSLATALAEVASTSTTLASFRDAALEFARRALDVEVGLFTTVGLEGMGVSAEGLSGGQTQLARNWDEYGGEIRAVKDAALRDGVSTDRRVLGRAVEQTRLYRDIMAEVGGTESLLLVPSFRGRNLGLLMLGRCGGRFSNAAVSAARSFAPILSVSCAAFGATSQMLDARLSQAERDLLSYLELGYSSRDIAAARGTSFFTVRNQLSTLYRRLGVANRTEAVGLLRRR